MCRIGLDRVWDRGRTAGNTNSYDLFLSIWHLLRLVESHGKLLSTVTGRHRSDFD